MATTEGAGVPRSPRTDFAVDGTGVFVARLSVRESRADVATMFGMGDDPTAAGLGTLAAGEGAGVP